MKHILATTVLFISVISSIAFAAPLAIEVPNLLRQ